MIPEDTINKNLTQLAKKMGEKNASALLSVLGKDKQFMTAIESPIGQELLKDAISEIENKIRLILAEKDNPKERAELQAYLQITRKWQATISRYNKNKEMFNKNVI